MMIFVSWVYTIMYLDLTDASKKTIIERDSDLETVEKKIEIQGIDTFYNF